MPCSGSHVRCKLPAHQYRTSSASSFDVVTVEDGFSHQTLRRWRGARWPHTQDPRTNIEHRVSFLDYGMITPSVTRASDLCSTFIDGRVMHPLPERPSP